jgi:hypothetical protein
LATASVREGDDGRFDRSAVSAPAQRTRPPAQRARPPATATKSVRRSRNRAATRTAAYTRKETTMYIGAGTIVLILLVVIVVMMIRGRRA